MGDNIHYNKAKKPKLQGKKGRPEGGAPKDRCRVSSVNGVLLKAENGPRGRGPSLRAV